MESCGLIHLYYGDGKGKTTAACGLSARMLGCGKKVVFAQFFKDGASSELNVLRRAGASVLCRPEYGDRFCKIPLDRRGDAREAFRDLLHEAFACASSANLLVLDECCAALSHGMIDEDDLIALLKDRPSGLEVVMTGRNPSETLIACADYATQMTAVKHPYSKGIAARRGVEF